MDIGDILNSSLELSTLDHEIINFNELLFGVNYLFVLFIPYCFSYSTDTYSLDNLIEILVNNTKKLSELDIKCIIISTENLSVIRHWLYEKSFYPSLNFNTINVLCDSSKEITKELVGTFNLSSYLEVEYGVIFDDCDNLEAPLPSLLIFDSEGQLIQRHLAASPGNSFISLFIQFLYLFLLSNSLTYFPYYR